jgi:hypothetical protein
MASGQQVLEVAPPPARRRNKRRLAGVPAWSIGDRVVHERLGEVDAHDGPRSRATN